MKRLRFVLDLFYRPYAALKDFQAYPDTYLSSFFLVAYCVSATFGSFTKLDQSLSIWVVAFFLAAILVGAIGVLLQAALIEWISKFFGCDRESSSLRLLIPLTLFPMVISNISKLVFLDSQSVIEMMATASFLYALILLILCVHLDRKIGILKSASVTVLGIALISSPVMLTYWLLST